MTVPRLRWCPIYVGIGSNLDSPEDQVRQAIVELGSLPDSCVTAVSSLYRSAPMGPADQADFVNAVAAMLTRLAPRELLAELQKIEDDHGRDREGPHWGPRTLDLDLLVFGNSSIAESDLIVPHPGICQRNFVLLPLCELAPNLMVPGMGTVTTLTDVIAGSNARIEKIAHVQP